MSHITIIIFVFTSTVSVVFAQTWLVVLEDAIPISCRSRFQTRLDVKQFSDCVDNIIRYFENSRKGIDGFCKKDISSCFKTLADTIKHCLDDEKYDEVFGNPLKAAQGGMEYACSYNGQPLADLLNKGVQCRESNPDVRLQTNQCFEQKFPNATDFELTFSSDENCAKLIELSICLIDVWSTCEDETVSDFIKKLSLNMLNQTPCKDLTHALYVYTPETLNSTPTQSIATIQTINALLLGILVILALGIVIMTSVM